MSTSGEKRRARDLQRRTGWTYSEALRCVRTMTPAAIEALISIRSVEAADDLNALEAG